MYVTMTAKLAHDREILIRERHLKCWRTEKIPDKLAAE